jgi:hypothetical protein
MENSDKKNRQGSYLPPEDLQRFGHALDTLDKANQMLLTVVNRMKPADGENLPPVESE